MPHIVRLSCVYEIKSIMESWLDVIRFRDRYCFTTSLRTNGNSLWNFKPHPDGSVVKSLPVLYRGSEWTAGNGQEIETQPPAKKRRKSAKDYDILSLIKQGRQWFRRTSTPERWNTCESSPLASRCFLSIYVYVCVFLFFTLRSVLRGRGGIASSRATDISSAITSVCPDTFTSLKAFK